MIVRHSNNPHTKIYGFSTHNLSCDHCWLLPRTQSPCSFLKKAVRIHFYRAFSSYSPLLFCSIYSSIHSFIQCVCICYVTPWKSEDSLWGWFRSSTVWATQVIRLVSNHLCPASHLNDPSNPVFYVCVYRAGILHECETKVVCSPQEMDGASAVPWRSTALLGHEAVDPGISS